MGYEGLTRTMREGFLAWLVIVAACMTWLFGGSFRQALRAGHDWIWPQPEAEAIDERVDLIHEETERLMSTLDREPEDHVVVARRFLRGEMTSDLSALGATMANRVLAIRVIGLDHERWSDERLAGIIRGREPDLLDRRVVRRIEEDVRWDETPEFAMSM